VSQYPRIVLAPGCWVADGIPNRPGAQPVMLWVRPGTVVDAPPGGTTEALYGASNLSAVIGPRDQRRAPEMCDDFDKSALSN
jgi:hypothetical protein